MPQGTKQFVCEGCGKPFPNREDLQTHVKDCQALKASSDNSKIRTAGGRSFEE